MERDGGLRRGTLAFTGDVVPVGKACDILRTAVMAVMAPRKRCEDSPAGASGVIRL